MEIHFFGHGKVMENHCWKRVVTLLKCLGGIVLAHFLQGSLYWCDCVQLCMLTVMLLRWLWLLRDFAMQMRRRSRWILEMRRLMSTIWLQCHPWKSSQTVVGASTLHHIRLQWQMFQEENFNHFTKLAVLSGIEQMSFWLAYKTGSDVADLMSWGSLFQTEAAATTKAGITGENDGAECKCFRLGTSANRPHVTHQMIIFIY